MVGGGGGPEVLQVAVRELCIIIEQDGGLFAVKIERGLTRERSEGEGGQLQHGCLGRLFVCVYPALLITKATGTLSQYSHKSQTEKGRDQER